MTNSLEVKDPEIVLATSGESFHWAKRFLGKKMGYDAARLYSFCRVLDDMADGDIPNGHEHLTDIQNTLNKLAEKDLVPININFSAMPAKLDLLPTL